MFQKKIVITIVPVAMIILLLSTVEYGTWGMNKTVGWAWDLGPIGWFIFLLTVLSFILLYTILLWQKRKLNKILISAQIILFVSIGLFYKLLGEGITLLLQLLLAFLFFVNLIVVLTKKKASQ